MPLRNQSIAASHPFFQLVLSLRSKLYQRETVVRVVFLLETIHDIHKKKVDLRLFYTTVLAPCKIRSVMLANSRLRFTSCTRIMFAPFSIRIHVLAPVPLSRCSAVLTSTSLINVLRRVRTCYRYDNCFLMSSIC